MIRGGYHQCCNHCQRGLAGGEVVAGSYWAEELEVGRMDDPSTSVADVCVCLRNTCSQVMISEFRDGRHCETSQRTTHDNYANNGARVSFSSGVGAVETHLSS